MEKQDNSKIEYCNNDNNDCNQETIATVSYINHGADSVINEDSNNHKLESWEEIKEKFDSKEGSDKINGKKNKHSSTKDEKNYKSLSKKISEESKQKIQEPRKGENDIRIAFLGHAKSGKSTLAGVLGKGEVDDGNGKARQHVYNFDHVSKNGTTIRLSQDFTGYDENNWWIKPEEDTEKKK